MRETEERFHKMFLNHHACMVLIDPDLGKIDDANTSACNYYGYSLARMKSMKIEEINVLSPTEVNAARQRAKSGNQNYFEFKHRLASGEIRDVEVYSSPIIVQGKTLLFSVIHDITQRKKAEADLKESYEKLDAFVHTLSHDLRTPIIPIIGYAELLQENYKEQLDEQGLSFLEEIKEAGLGMLDLMEGLLSLAQSESLERPVEPVSTNEVVAGVIKNLKTHIDRVGIVLQVNGLPSTRVPKIYLAQIFDNLIGNAVRYAGKDGDLIEIGGKQKSQQVRFFVRDNGPGIPESERKQVFEIFYRGTEAKESKGTGVGLAIVQKIARNYGGQAWVEETPGGGCTFWVEMADAP